MTQTEPGILYLVATPIGNLRDFTFRAVEVLQRVDLIACEDTRHSRPLLDHYGISKPTAAFHEHNEDAASSRLIERLRQGESIALISDAGTPLINDPGFPLVRSARAAGIQVVPVPGPCALIAAVSASGLPADRFAFEGFLPRKSSARKASLEALRDDSRTLIFYESSHRVVECVADIAAVFPSKRRLVIARELTKLFETIVDTRVGEALLLLEGNPDMRKGEFVLVLEGAADGGQAEGLTVEEMRVLRILLEECSVKTAVSLAVKITGARRETVYRTALRLTERRRETD
ncbi:16S rRNA (cytidine(1402)-2'-O)-methyltransferase [Methylocaldum sp.]|uniref:16S rRNA (cytidine(1402)-2'-O)-methyltransferase n=1 Tax=Methylocaldum sp. TaxID=1969727 RepID=UPI002D2E4E51|nr:16S rRNA (cytidine(1402)-2'-O)-methyltransferase [Methylocaldum sp.]HYE36031.1 16S rRNA (cytidine(1402)-2'-O)-methyltransferase [Methylocaldum sp.]